MFEEKVKTTVTTFIKLPNSLTQNSWSLKWSKKKNQRPYLTRNTSRTRIVIDYRVWMQGIKFKVEELLSLLLFCQHITRFLLTPLFCDSGNKYRSKHHGNGALVYGYIYISLPSSLFCSFMLRYNLFWQLRCLPTKTGFLANQQSLDIDKNRSTSHDSHFLDRDLSVTWYQKRQKQIWSTYFLQIYIKLNVSAITYFCLA